ncbi:DUF4236 domain-containing protein [Halomonas sp. E14]
MALRFRRRIRIAPGISLNLSKSGIGRKGYQKADAIHDDQAA